jgi:hypothetical protein
VTNDDKALKVVLPLVVASSLVLVLASRDRRAARPNPRQSAPDEAEPTVQPVAVTIPHLSVPQSQSEGREYQYLTSPWRRGWLEACGVVMALGLLSVNLLQSRATSQSTQQAANAAKRTAEATARQLELAQRPWISIDTSVVSPLTFDQDGDAQVMVNFVIRNLGDSPAKDLSVEPEMYVASGGEKDPQMERSKVCEENRMRGSGMDGMLFPKSEITKSMIFHADAKDIVQESNRTGGFLPAVIVCASYGSTFDNSSRYTTGIIYLLHKIEPDHPGSYSRMKSGVEVPKELLALTYDPLEAIAAN